ncbi:MAG: hypothetical protein JST00_38070 [Deltaproteobacteria bacterium]|nr:hypothetical protein [Deltaproteobacteria bacterium]
MSDVASLKLSLIASAFAAVSTLSTVACAPAQQDAEPEAETSVSALGETATITFRGDYEEQVDGVLEKGRKVRIAYDASRLTACRGEQNGRPAWTITGNYRIGDGPVKTFEAGGFSPSGSTAAPVIDLDAAGDLQIWFQNTSVWGCNAYDSNFGGNYHFAVKPAANAPGWIGNVRSLISRQTCNGPCDFDMRPINGPVVYDTWARQRAAIRGIYFEVWKDGVTNWDNPDLWRQLDVQVHTRVGGVGAFKSSYVSFDRRVGNNARYGIDLRALDPLADNVPGVPLVCPPLTRRPGYVIATVDLYVTVNGVELRPEGGGVFQVRYENYEAPYASCP